MAIQPNRMAIQPNQSRQCGGRAQRTPGMRQVAACQPVRHPVDDWHGAAPGVFGTTLTAALDLRSSPTRRTTIVTGSADSCSAHGETYLLGVAKARGSALCLLGQSRTPRRALALIIQLELFSSGWLDGPPHGSELSRGAAHGGSSGRRRQRTSTGGPCSFGLSRAGSPDTLVTGAGSPTPCISIRGLGLAWPNRRVWSSRGQVDPRQSRGGVRS